MADRTAEESNPSPTSPIDVDAAGDSEPDSPLLSPPPPRPHPSPSPGSTFIDSLNDMLWKLLCSRPRDLPPHLRLSLPSIQKLCRDAGALFGKMPNVICVDSPVCIVGDLHGQDRDLLAILHRLVGRPNESTVQYLFLGDYLDRGDASLRVILLLFALSLRYPSRCWLLRGNHETRQQAGRFGLGSMTLRRELRTIFSNDIDGAFAVFDAVIAAAAQLPVAAIVDGKLFCCHGGIGPRVRTIERINRIHRKVEDLEEKKKKKKKKKKGGIPVDASLSATPATPKIPIPTRARSMPRLRRPPKKKPNKNSKQKKPKKLTRSQKVLGSLLWSDPRDTISKGDSSRTWKKNKKRLAGVIWGEPLTREFLHENNLEMIVRAHEAEMNGASVRHNAKVLTVFSASRYCGEANLAAVLQYDSRMCLIRRFSSFSSSSSSDDSSEEELEDCPSSLVSLSLPKSANIWEGELVPIEGSGLEPEKPRLAVNQVFVLSITNLPASLRNYTDVLAPAVISSSDRSHSSFTRQLSRILRKSRIGKKKRRGRMDEGEEEEGEIEQQQQQQQQDFFPEDEDEDILSGGEDAETVNLRPTKRAPKSRGNLMSEIRSVRTTRRKSDAPVTRKSGAPRSRTDLLSSVRAFTRQKRSDSLTPAGTPRSRTDLLASVRGFSRQRSDSLTRTGATPRSRSDLLASVRGFSRQRSDSLTPAATPRSRTDLLASVRGFGRQRSDSLTRTKGGTRSRVDLLSSVRGFARKELNPVRVPFTRFDLMSEIRKKTADEEEGDDDSETEVSLFGNLIADGDEESLQEQPKPEGSDSDSDSDSICLFASTTGISKKKSTTHPKTLSLLSDDDDSDDDDASVAAEEEEEEEAGDTINLFSSLRRTKKINGKKKKKRSVGELMLLGEEEEEEEVDLLGNGNEEEEEEEEEAVLFRSLRGSRQRDD